MTAIVVIASSMIGTNVMAAGTCKVGYTGPDANNKCISRTAYTCDSVNDTHVRVSGQNQQIAVSGDASGVGGATGSATNANGTVFDVTIKNDTCVVVATIPASAPPAQSSPSAPKVVVQAPQQATVSELPNTSSLPLDIIVMVLVALGTCVFVSRAGVMMYQFHQG